MFKICVNVFSVRQRNVLQVFRLYFFLCSPTSPMRIAKSAQSVTTVVPRMTVGWKKL